MKESVTIDYAGRTLTVETGSMAKQADGSALVRYADTVVLVTAVADKEPSDRDFLPLTVNYQEMSYAAGRFPGGFFKREGRPSDREVLMSRLIDRPLRPSFPKGYRNETQVIATVLSSDQENDPAILGILGASCALTLSDIPFSGPLAGVKIGRRNGVLIVNPTQADAEESDMDIIVVGTKDAILMVEGATRFVSGEDLTEAISFAHQNLLPLLALQEELRDRVGRPKWSVSVDERIGQLKSEIVNTAESEILTAFAVPVKQARGQRLEDLRKAFLEKYSDVPPNTVSAAYEEATRELLRKELLSTGKRIDGRGPKDIRPISCAAGILPRTHGSSLFTRGETQALAIVTFGTAEDEQKVESLLEGETFKTFMLHYNFPPFSVGEVAMLRAPSRREIGHGNLAERALRPVLPSKEQFPYTIRIVSEILESNGSSSMATVCSGCMALMDAGVPIEQPVAGIAMGLVKEGDQQIVLTDILGDEDHLGDMDFKVAGTRDGITAIQMDIKIKGITKELMSRAVEQAQQAIGTILGIMSETLEKPRDDLSPYAPRIFTITIKPDKIREVIGPGGKIIRGIIEQTGVKIDIDDSGLVRIASPDENSANAAIDIIKRLVKEFAPGEVITGKVKKVLESGAIVELGPGADGFVHVSQLAEGFLKKVSDAVKEGDTITVKVMEVEASGRIRLSRKAVLKDEKDLSDQKDPQA
jgi:polyribonucleotide nucleotidyltransferase